VDIVATIRSAPLADLAIVVLLLVCFILGVMQGSIHRLLSILAMLLAFVVAAVARNNVGDFFAGNWTQFDAGYDRLLAFVLVFLLAAIVLEIAITGFYNRMELYARHPIVDDVIGGMLGVLEGLLILTVVVIILGSYPLPIARSGDVSILRDVQDAVVRQSHIASFLHDWIAPTLVHLLSPLLPSELVKLWP